MARFYLLPSRSQFGERVAGYLGELFPGLDWPSAAWANLAETLGEVALRRPDTFVVYREDLPREEDLTTALTDGYGADAGDEVVELIPAAGSAALIERRWRLGNAA